MTDFRHMFFARRSRKASCSAFHCCMLLFFAALEMASAKTVTYDLSKMGYTEYGSYSKIIFEVIARIKSETQKGDNIILMFSQKEYTFLSDGTEKADCYISNHDQTNPRNIVMDFSGIDNLTVEGNGASFLFDGRMIPIVARNCRNLTLQNFSIDFSHPQITQFDVIFSDRDKGTQVYIPPGTNYRLDRQTGRFINIGNGWTVFPASGNVFDASTKTPVYGISDIPVDTYSSDMEDEDVVTFPHWYNPDIKPGMVVVARSAERPCPGIFLSECRDTYVRSVTVHYAEGMGLLAQRCENVTLDGFQVALRARNIRRCFTTQADATHFSGCRGRIVSINGLYENMMDDAINVHGTYLKVTRIADDRKSVIARYMHDMSWGFRWGEEGDSIRFVSSRSLCGKFSTVVRTVRPNDAHDTDGAREFYIAFADTLPAGISEDDLGIENLTWTPEVQFTSNVIRHNRARGCLFSTPRRVVIENNLFSQISGCAILIPGDCSGRYESGACCNVLVKGNRFIDVLTSMYQFTEAVISIYPVISEILPGEYFHSGIRIEKNYFETFDRPLVYAKSVDGLVFSRNIVYGDTRQKPFHSNRYTFNLTHVRGFREESTTFSGNYSYSREKDLHMVE